MTTTPPERIELDGIVIRRETDDDAGPVAEAIASNIPRLAPWMEWAVDVAAGVEAQRTRIADALTRWAADSVYDYVIVDQALSASGHAEVLGKTGLHRTAVGVVEIGYWLTAGAEGKGTMTRVAAAMTDIAIGLDGTTRVEIHCDAANLRSQAIPRRLGYRLDRVVDHPITTSHQTGRQMIWFYDASL